MDTLRVVLLLAAAAIVLLWVFVSPSAVLIQSAPQLRQLAPKGTPIEIIEKLNKEISTVVADPNVKSRLVGLGVSPMSMTSAEFGKLIADETENWSKVIEFAGIKPE